MKKITRFIRLFPHETHALPSGPVFLIMFRCILFITSYVTNVIIAAHSYPPEIPKMKEMKQIRNPLNSNEAPNKRLIIGNTPSPLPSN